MENNKQNKEKELLNNNKIYSESFDKEIIGAPVRFTIMLLLNTHKSIPNAILRKLLEISSGKLDHHIRILEKEGYIKKETKIFSNRPGSLIIITKKGKKDFKNYSLQLRDVLNKIEL